MKWFEFSTVAHEGVEREGAFLKVEVVSRGYSQLLC